MRRSYFLAAAAVAAIFGLTACQQQPSSVTYKAHLTAKDEVPANTSTAVGDGTFIYDPTTKTLSWTVTYAGLTGPATLAHIHGPAAPGVNAGVQIPLGPNGNLPSPITGKATLNDAQAADLAAGKYYANVHTNANKGGEIRGQLMQ